MYSLVQNAHEEGPPKSKKKRVSWAPEDSLYEVQYFEVDESERGVWWSLCVCLSVRLCVYVHVSGGHECALVLMAGLPLLSSPTSHPCTSYVVHHGTGNFLDAAQREKYLERQAMHAARMMANDKMEEVVPVSMRVAASTPQSPEKH